ncbi:MAG: hypothetical protein A2035_09030 [Nitrospirae bacterium GWA2_42_11]|nr:MAG: hypothetical protein A2035_09030 [Nitrospirae bacterium GWA2_42_11]
MKSIKLVALSLTIIIGIMFITPYYVRAEENKMKNVFMDTFYGMAAGALIATAISLTQKDPNWGANVGTGAAVGGIAGALFGVVTEMRYMAKIEDGQVHVSIPTIGINMEKTDRDEVMYSAGVLKYSF